MEAHLARRVSRWAQVDGESPLRGPDETMQPQLRLHVGDIVAGDAERLRLEKAVLRWEGDRTEKEKRCVLPLSMLKLGHLREREMEGFFFGFAFSVLFYFFLIFFCYQFDLK